MFRDSRGVVHTVSSVDPLDDLPPGAAVALHAGLLRGAAADLGGALERVDAVRDLLERWQDAFFASLSEQVDLAEEARWAAEAGLSLSEVEGEYDEDDDAFGPVERTGPEEDEDPDEELAAALALELTEPDPDAPDNPRTVLPEQLVSVLERELLLLPLRTRLEALVAAADLVDQWEALLADEEKLLGHLVLRHGQVPAAGPGEAVHESMVEQHAALHDQGGPGHDADHDTGHDVGSGTGDDVGSDTGHDVAGDRPEA